MKIINHKQAPSAERKMKKKKTNFDNIYNVELNKVYTSAEIAKICEVNTLPKSYQNISYWNSESSGIGKRLREKNLKAVLVSEMKVKFINKLF